MGWTNFRLNDPVRQWFKNQWENNGHYTVLDSALVRRSTLYAAVKRNETGEVFCVVYLTRWSKDYYNFSYKDLTEFCGPCEIECPERIFQLLSPLNDTEETRFAREWRQKVLEYLNKRKELNGNYIVKVENPIKFSNGISFSFFKKNGRNLYGGVMENDEFKTYCRVRKFDLTAHNYSFA